MAAGIDLALGLGDRVSVSDEGGQVFGKSQFSEVVAFNSATVLILSCLN